MALRAEPAPANRMTRPEGHSVLAGALGMMGGQADPTGLLLWSGETEQLPGGTRQAPWAPERVPV